MSDIRKIGASGFRGARGERGERGHRGPTGPTGPAGGQFAAEFVTPPVLNTIYVRTTGSDGNDGLSPATALATLQFATTKVPFLISPGQLWRIDITGVTEQLPPDFALPEWKTWATETVTPPPALTRFTPGVEIFAQPRPVSAMPLADTIINASDVASVTSDPITGLLTINLVTPRASWTTGNLLGKQVLTAPNDPNGGALSCVVAQVNSTSSILIAGDTLPMYPIQLAEPSAWLHGSGNNFGTLVANNIDNMGFTGVKITSDNGFVGLFAAGSGNCICQLCELDSPELAQQSTNIFLAPNQANRFLRSWIYNFPTLAGTSVVGQSLMLNATPASNFGYPMFGVPCTVIIFQSVFNGCDPVEVLCYVPENMLDPAATQHFYMTNTLVVNAVTDGIAFHGVTGRLVNVDVSSSTGNGITVDDGGGQLRLENVGSSVPNGGFGIMIEDGMQVSADVATTTNATLLTGASGDISLGSISPVPGGWATIAAPPNNLVDSAGPSATLARISQQ